MPLMCNHHHCKENHEAGHNTCTEQRYQQEITAVQARHRVSRNQAKAMVDRDQPNLRTKGCASAVKTAISGEGVRTDASQASGTAAARHAEIEEVEVVCMSLNSGKLFTETVNLSQGVDIMDGLKDRTSEDSAIIRAEVREIYEEMSRSTAENEEAIENNDRDQYETELNKTKKG